LTARHFWLLSIFVLCLALSVLWACDSETDDDDDNDDNNDDATPDDDDTDDDTGDDDEDNPPMPSGQHVPIVVDADVRDGELDERFIGVTVDTAQFIADRVEWGEHTHYTAIDPPDLYDPKLRNLAAALGPSLLRIGGTAADGTYFCPEEGESCELPPAYQNVYRPSSGFQASYLTHDDVRAIAEFAEAIDAEVIFCLNFGPGPRDAATGAWHPDNARELIRFVDTLDQADRFIVWEAGNEANSYMFNFRMPLNYGPEMYAGDLAVLRELVDAEDPEAMTAAPATYFFPLRFIGDIFRFTERALALGRQHVDLVTWHLYATQSETCGDTFFHQPFPATLENLFDEDIIATSRYYARYVLNAAQGVPVIMDESASAQCGGQAGVSDTLLDALWIVDWLGIMAQEGTRALVRQSLLDFDYGIIGGKTYEPRPTLLAMSALRRLVADARLSAEADRSLVKTHAWCSGETPSALTVVVSNPSTETVVAQIDVTGNVITAARQWTITSPDGLYGSRATIEGEFIADDGVVPTPDGSSVHRAAGKAFAAIAPESLVFVELELAQAPAGCP